MHFVATNKMTLLLLSSLIAGLCLTSVSCKMMLRLEPGRFDSVINGEYIIVFNDNVTQYDINVHHSILTKHISNQNNTNNAVIKNHQIGTSFKGYTAKLDDRVLAKIRSMAEVKYIERNMIVKAYSDCVTQSYASWGLVRTTIQEKVTDYDYTYNSNCNGNGVDVYIIDTGIQTDHPNFEGRAKWGFDYINSPSYETDDNGHGTHVAGIIGSSRYGLAKGTTLIAVKVLNGNGYGSWDGVIAGIEYVASQHQTTGRQSIINLSLGGWRNQAINDAVEAAKAVGVHVIVAAGNSRKDSCYSSPASAEVITVAASNINDQMAYFSNYGECVQIIAPGVSITSDWPTDTSKTLSGTSMASPHVAGVMAKYLTDSSCSQSDMSPDSMESYLTNKALSGVISSVPSYTPNFLVFQEC